MNMIEAVKSCFKKYFQFRGRARRSEYWYWILFTVLASVLFTIIDTFLFSNLAATGIEPTGLIFSLVTFVPGLSVTWRRLHDTNRSGWWYGGAILAFIFAGIIVGASLIATGFSYNFGTAGGILAVIFGLLALVWVITILVFTIQDSQYGENRFGPNPKGEGNASVFD